MTDSILQIVRQEDIEKRYNRKLIDGYIREEIEASPDVQAKLELGVQMLTDWMNGEYHESKKERIGQLKQFDLHKLVNDVFVGIAYVREPELFTSVTAQLASRLGFDDKADSIRTMAEIVAVLCQTDAFDIDKPSKMASLFVVSRIQLSDQLNEFIDQSAYLPPMVCEPLELKSNYDSGYLTHRDSLILGNGNHHDGDICLDVLNTLNKVALKLDTDFLCKVEENPNRDFTIGEAIEAAAKKGEIITELEAAERVREQIEQWNKFKEHSYATYLLMHQTGNRFHLTHKVDKRGRIYAQGYHITTQGTAFKKACIELANEELVTGVPNT